MADESIVIKKINKGGHAAHGGAWKVAYADFVTAMMAFFLLLWLLNATEAEKLAGLADYFAPTVGVAGNMGIGFRGGKGALSKGVGADNSTNKGIIFAAPTSGTVVKNPEDIEQENDLPDEEKITIVEEISSDASEEESENDSFNDVAQALNQEIASENISANVNIQNTPDGLKIQIVEKDKSAMFEKGNSTLTESAKKILFKIAKIISLLPNYVAIIGHTSSLPLGKGVQYTNWELSADRANSTRRFFVDSGVVKEQISRVVGKADHLPIDPKNPEAIENNRIDIILLRDAYLTYHKRTAPEEIFVDPNLADREDLISVEPTVVEPEAPEEIVEPETKGRDFFEGVEGQGLEYDSNDPAEGKETFVPREFFSNDVPGSDIFSNEALFGDETVPGSIEIPKKDEAPTTAEEKRKFFEEQLQMLPETTDGPDVIIDKGKDGALFPPDFFKGVGF